MVRRFMLSALDMGFINGEYVFMDVELFSFEVAFICVNVQFNT